MPPKQEKAALSYNKLINDIRKVTGTLQKIMNATLKKLKECPEDVKKQSREERKREEYEKCKKRYKFTDKEKNNLLDHLVDVFGLENMSGGFGYSVYEIEEFLDDNVPDFPEKARVLMEKCRSDLEKLLPPTVASKTLRDLS